MLTRVLIALALVASATAQFPGARRATAGTGARRASAGEWNYDDADATSGPVHWAEICSNQAGAGQQSPVHLCGATKWGASAPTLAFTGYNEAHDFTLLNPSHRIGGVQIVAPAGVSLKADGLAQLVDRGSAVSGYTLVQAHFHWCAEHHIEGRQPPLEAHFVHMDSKFADLTAALGSGEKSALLVVGQFYEVFTSESPALTTIAVGLKDMARRAGSATKTIKAAELIDTTGGYYSYGGSLTTPTCNAVVTWVVMANSLPITQKSLDMFLAIKQEAGDLTRIHGNARPLQALGSRTVYTSASASAACPTKDNFCMEAGTNYGKTVAGVDTQLDAKILGGVLGGACGLLILALAYMCVRTPAAAPAAPAPIVEATPPSKTSSMPYPGGGQTVGGLPPKPSANPTHVSPKPDR